MVDRLRDGDRVELSDYESEWRDRYDGEGVRLLEALGDSVRAIEHVGATAVEGMVGRSIVDIAIGVDSLEAATQHVPALQQLGYEYFGEAGLEGRRFFRKREPAAFNLELLLHRGRHWEARLCLREYLRAHPEAVDELSEAKRSIAAGCDAEEYAERKADLLDEWTERALEWNESESAG